MDIQYRTVTPADCAAITAITDACVNAEDEYRAYIAELCARADSSVVGILVLCDGEPGGVALCVKGMELTGGRDVCGARGISEQEDRLRAVSARNDGAFAQGR